MAAKMVDGYPNQWRDWSQANTDKRVKSSKGLNRFAATYRAARLFHGIHSEPASVGGEWERGFSALLKVFLAYTAADSLARGLPGHYRENLRGFEINNETLAKRIRENNELLKLLIDEITSNELILNLNSFVSGQSSDVFYVASAIRHLVAHGTITVGGAKVRSKEKAEALLKLADAVLECSNRKFCEFYSTRLHVSSTSAVKR